jgi:hypothetical protein
MLSHIYLLPYNLANLYKTLVTYQQLILLAEQRAAEAVVEGAVDAVVATAVEEEGGGIFTSAHTHRINGENCHQKIRNVL